VNAWHWSERSCLAWSRQRLGELLTGLPAELDPSLGHARVTGVKELTGEARPARAGACALRARAPGKAQRPLLPGPSELRVLPHPGCRRGRKLAGKEQLHTQPQASAAASLLSRASRGAQCAWQQAQATLRTFQGGGHLVMKRAVPGAAAGIYNGKERQQAARRLRPHPGARLGGPLGGRRAGGNACPACCSSHHCGRCLHMQHPSVSGVCPGSAGQLPGTLFGQQGQSTSSPRHRRPLQPGLQLTCAALGGLRGCMFEHGARCVGEGRDQGGGIRASERARRLHLHVHGRHLGRHRGCTGTAAPSRCIIFSARRADWFCPNFF